MSLTNCVQYKCEHVQEAFYSQMFINIHAVSGYVIFVLIAVNNGFFIIHVYIYSMWLNKSIGQSVDIAPLTEKIPGVMLQWSGERVTSLAGTETVSAAETGHVWWVLLANDVP